MQQTLGKKNSTCFLDGQQHLTRLKSTLFKLSISKNMYKGCVSYYFAIIEYEQLLFLNFKTLI